MAEKFQLTLIYRWNLVLIAGRGPELKSAFLHIVRDLKFGTCETSCNVVLRVRQSLKKKSQNIGQKVGYLPYTLDCETSNDLWFS